MILDTPDRRSKNIRVHPVVVPKLKLCNVQREAFGTDFVETADDTAL